MPYLVGVVLGLVTALFVRITGFDRDRAAYRTALVAIGSYYCLFAVMGGSMPALGLELAVTLVFTAAAVLGFAVNLWWGVAGLRGTASSTCFTVD